MTDLDIRNLGTARVLLLPDDGPVLGSEDSAIDIIGLSYGQDIDLIAMPVTRLAGDFFELSNKMAGEFIQKFRNYHHRVAFVGNISPHVARSGALRDYVYESNKRRDVLFVPDLETLAAYL
jgi:hypothetical protein